MRANQFKGMWSRLVTAIVISASALALAACGGGEQADRYSTSETKVSAFRLAVAVQEQLPSIIRLTKVSETRVGRTTFDYVFKVTIQGGSIDYGQALARVINVGSGTSIVDGEVQIGNIANGATLEASDTITLRHDRAIAFNLSAITWAVTATPVARSVEIAPNAVTFKIGRAHV